MKNEEAPTFFVENSASFVLKIEVLLAVLSNFKRQASLALQTRYFDGQPVWLIFGITISVYRIHVKVCSVCLFGVHSIIILSRHVMNVYYFSHQWVT